MQENYLEDEINKSKKATKILTSGTESLFDSIKESFYNKKGKEVRIIKDKENSIYYILLKTTTNLSVYSKEIYSFEKKESLSEKFKYEIMNLDEDKKLYLPLVYSLNLNSNENSFTSKLLKFIPKDKNEKKLKENLELYLKNAPLSEKEFNHSSSDVGTIKKYINYLTNNKIQTDTLSESDYLNLLTPFNKTINEKLDNLYVNFEFFKEICKTKKFNEKKQFEYNDMDNHVWLHNDKLIITDQNCGFYIDIKDKDNFQVHFLTKEYTDTKKLIKELEEKIKNNTLDIITDSVLIVENGKVKLANSMLMYVLELDVEFSYKAFKERKLGEIKHDVNITSYEYQKNYYYDRYGYSEFEFLAQAFLTLGGGFDYDKKTGTFVDDGVKYKKNLKIEKVDKSKTYTNFSYCWPKDFTYLNDDWLKGLKYLVHVLKVDKPIPIVYQDKIEETREEAMKAVEKTVEILEKNINALEKKAKNKIR